MGLSPLPSAADAQTIWDPPLFPLCTHSRGETIIITLGQWIAWLQTVSCQSDQEGAELRSLHLQGAS